MKLFTISVRTVLGVLIAAGAFSFVDPTPAAAGDRYTKMGRSATQFVYGQAGKKVCGRACAKAGRQVGGRVYDKSRRFTDWYGQKSRNAGRKLNRSYCRKNPSSRICRR